jgi:ribosome-associated toxin RatA of RatAB toxin-antitoxin module
LSRCAQDLHHRNRLSGRHGAGDGPFKFLQGYWRFEELDDRACKVSLDLKFEFSNRLLAFAVGPVFSNIANGLVDSFRRRAEEIYGKR